MWHEQLRAPMSWWLLGAAFALTVVWVVWVVAPGASAVAAGVAAAGVAFFALHRFSSTVIAVHTGPDGATLLAGRGRLPLSVAGGVHALDADELHRQAGRDADARAFLVLPPFVPTAVRLDLADPADPTPYWLVATRSPDRLAAVLAGLVNASPGAAEAGAGAGAEVGVDPVTD